MKLHESNKIKKMSRNNGYSHAILQKMPSSRIQFIIKWKMLKEDDIK